MGDRFGFGSRFVNPWPFGFEELEVNALGHAHQRLLRLDAIATTALVFPS